MSASVTWAFLHLVPAAFSAVEWIPYDIWTAFRPPMLVDPSVVVIVRDAETDRRFGTGPLDHAVFARMITALKRAGAEVIGLGVKLVGSSPPGRGGAASDAMLIEATRTAGRVVYPLNVRLDSSESPPAHQEFSHPSWPVLAPSQLKRLRPALPEADTLPGAAQYARHIGYTASLADHMGMDRLVPLFVRVGDRAVPAFGMALAAAWLHVPPERILIRNGRVVLQSSEQGRPSRDLTIPTDGRTQIMIDYAGQRHHQPFPALSFVEVWNAIDHGDVEDLHHQLQGKLVLLLAAEDESSQDRQRLSPDSLVQVHLLNTLLTQSWVTAPPAWVTFILALGLAGLAARSLLSIERRTGSLGVSLLLGGYTGLVLLILWTSRVALPFAVPLVAIILAAGVGMLWVHLTAGPRIKQLEEKVQTVHEELARVRDNLVRRESAVEALEEDLEAARSAIARSAGKEQELVRSAEHLRAQLIEARSQEEMARQALQRLTDEVQGLKAFVREDGPLDNPDHERLRGECERLGILTRDPNVLQLFHDLKKVAQSSLPVLIQGEPGTGKELFARAVHRLSRRADQPFIAVNMAAVAPDLFESELFGHVKGSFTGALGDRKGYFEQAHHGTIFLDEIGDLRLDHQGKLLRVLEEKTFYRVGESRPTSVDVRIVAATNRDLQQGVGDGWFREDLYFRLKGLVVRLPPLRDRRGDISLLAERIVKEAAEQARRPDLALSRDAMAALESHEWKGNVRELRQCLEQAVALAEGRTITEGDLRLAAGHDRRDRPSPIDASGDAAVLDCLRRHGFDMQATARVLGWDRSTVTQRLKGMSFRALVEAGGNQTEAARVLAGTPALMRAVELKIRDYFDHLIVTIQGYRSADEAIAACRKRFKNLPDRHFQSVEILVKQYFSRSGSA